MFSEKSTVCDLNVPGTSETTYKESDIESAPAWQTDTSMAVGTAAVTTSRVYDLDINETVKNVPTTDATETTLSVEEMVAIIISNTASKNSTAPSNHSNLLKINSSCSPATSHAGSTNDTDNAENQGNVIDLTVGFSFNSSTSSLTNRPCLPDARINNSSTLLLVTDGATSESNDLTNATTTASVFSAFNILNELLNIPDGENGTRRVNFSELIWEIGQKANMSEKWAEAMQTTTVLPVLPQTTMPSSSISNTSSLALEMQFNINEISSLNQAHSVS